MKVTKQQIEDARIAYELYWKSYLNGDTETLEALLDEEYTQVGSVENEVFFTKKDAVQFIVDTIDQVAGNLEMRNRITKYDPVDGLILFYEQCDLYVLSEEGWVFYSKFRASSLMKEQKDGWKMIHQHSSLPDYKAQEGENIAIEKISEENLMLREAIKRRTVELEHKTRDLEVEAALERVRNRSLAMNASDELAETATVMFQQLKSLGVVTYSSGITLWETDGKEMVNWACSPDGTMNPPFKLTIAGDPWHTRQYESWKKGEVFIVKDLAGEEMQEHFRYLRTYPLLDEVFEKIVASGHPMPERQVHHVANFSQGNLLFIALKPYPEAHDIFKRFAKVFEQTYTRFLDLQKAEEQAREAQIEAALERVRSRTMAMQKSEELTETSQIFFQQMKELGEPVEQLTIGIVKETENVVEVFATVQGSQLPQSFPHSIDEPFVMNKIYKGWKEQEKSLLIEMNSEEIQAYNRYRNELVKSEMFSTTVAKDDRRIIYAAYFSKGMVALGSNTPLSEESHRLLERFATVFDGTYTRFLDLQKAEAQAREAEIELALERVRARTMAMQKSEELIATAELLFDQLKRLGAESQGVAFAICEEDSVMVQKWTSIGVFSVPYTYEPGEQRMYEAWKNKVEIYEEIYEGERLRKYYELFMEIPAFKEGIQKFIDSGYPLPPWQKNHAIPFKHGYLLLITSKVFEETKIFTRFAKVFEQTYTRFLDLQKAEASAREAKIEVAVERVRAKALAMHRSEDLHAVVVTLKKELMGLQIRGVAAATIYLEQDDGTIRILDLSSVDKVEEDGSEFKMDKVFRIEDTDPDLWVRKIWNGKENYFVVEADEADFDRIVAWLYTMDEAEAAIAEKIIREKLIKKAWLPTVKLEKGKLNIDLLEPPTPEIKSILLKMGAGFDLAYKRFLDLQKAEAQAKEAKIEAALERIRSSALAMHSSDGILDVTQVLREQIALLGEKELEFILVHIYHEDTDQFEAWYSYRHPENNDEEIVNGKQMLSWRQTARARKDKEKYYGNESDYTIVADNKMLKEWYEYLFAIIPEVVEVNKDGKPLVPEVLYYNYSKISGGTLLLITNSEASNHSKYLLKRAARVFNLAYSRFLDLQKAEAQAREAQIEAALERVRSRTMAMQSSEELADAASVLFEQLNILGVTHERINIGIVNEPDQTIDFWVTEQGGKKLNTKFSGRISEPTTLAKSYQAWKKGDKSITIDLKGQELKDWLKFMAEEIKIPFDKAFQHDRRVQTAGFFSKGMLVVTSPEPLVEEALYLLEKFAGVFDLTYTRFSDLKVAEAQAKRAEKDLIEIKAARQKAEVALKDLKAAQEQLVQQEKLASLGQLTAGIAHEIKNPLNFVNNFSDLSRELIEEVFEELEKLESSDTKDEIIAILQDVNANLLKVHEHGTRANGIVTSMLQHSRASSSKREPKALNPIVKEFVNLAYHGMRAARSPINVDIDLQLDPKVGDVSLISEDFSRVILNLCNNAFDAMRDKLKTEDGRRETEDGIYLPKLTVKTALLKDKVILSIGDNGGGIPDEIRDKILQPFFTTKKGTEGTGLGLSITNDIIKAHGGELKIDSTSEEGTCFLIQLPN